MAVDPICGMTVDESKGLTAERDGQTYYFCSRGCREKFLAGPSTKSHSHQHHAHSAPAAEPIVVTSGGAAAERQSAADTDAIYTCPMHPEIEQRGPGTCPKCGMALEPKTFSADEPEDDSELVDMTRRFWVATALGVPVLLLAMLPMVGVRVDHWLGHTLYVWLQLVLATPAVLWAGWPLLVRGVRSFASLNLNMFALIALGVGAAYIYSLVAVLAPGLIPEAFKHDGNVEVYFRGGGGDHGPGAFGPGARTPRPPPHGHRDPRIARARAADGPRGPRWRRPRGAARRSEIGRRAPRPPGRKDSCRRRAYRGHEHGRRIDAHRRADAGREARRRRGDRRHGEPDGCVLDGSPEGRQRHDAGPHRRHGRQGPAEPRRSSAWPTRWRPGSCRS